MSAAGESADPLAAFRSLDLRVGTVRAARPNAGARQPAYELEIDLGGERGVVRSSAQLTANHACEELVGRQVVVLCGLPPRRVAGVRSEVLVLAAVCPARGAVLLGPAAPVADGAPVA